MEVAFARGQLGHLWVVGLFAFPFPKLLGFSDAGALAGGIRIKSAGIPKLR